MISFFVGGGLESIMRCMSPAIGKIELTNPHTLCPPPIVAARGAKQHKTRMHTYTPWHPIPSLRFQYTDWLIKNPLKDNHYTRITIL